MHSNAPAWLHERAANLRSSKRKTHQALWPTASGQSRNDEADGGLEPKRFVVSWPIQLAAIASFGLYLHSLLWWTEPRDMGIFLRPWFEHIVRSGPTNAFAHPFSNYTPAYLYLLALVSLFHRFMDAMYLIKLLSVAGTAFAMFAVGDLIKSTGGRPKYALLVFAMPSVAINAALLAQCDALWAGACVLAISCMVRGRTAQSLVWCGLAFAFKAQAAFIAPFMIGAMFGRRPPLWNWTIPLLVFAGIMLPAWLAGWPAWDLAMVYPKQVAWVPFPSRLANPWIIATIIAPDAAKDYYWVGYVAAALAAVVIAALSSVAVRDRRATVVLALLSSLALPFLLPKMIERYYFLADLLSLVVAVSFASRTMIMLALSVQLASSLSLLTYMYFYTRPFPTIVGAVLAAIAMVTTCILARDSARECSSLIREWPRAHLRRRLNA